MRKVCVLGVVFFTGLGSTALAHEGPHVTLKVSGVVCEGCAKEVQAAIANAGGFKPLHKIAHNQGEGPVKVMVHMHGVVDFGALAKSINKANTPHKAKSPPGVAVVFFAKLDEKSAKAAREALGTLKGVDARASTIDPEKGEISIKLTGEERVTPLDLVRALKKAGVTATIRTPGQDDE